MREGWETAVAFDPVDQIVAAEAMRLMGSNLRPDERFNQFVVGAKLARDLILARAKKEYRDRINITGTVLFVKAMNDLLSACILMRVGYVLQSTPCLRAALETLEVVEFLSRNPDSAEDYIAGRGRFTRNLNWIREQLPATKERSKAFSYFNYFSHSNFKGLRIYTAYDSKPGVEAVEVGPTGSLYPEIIPYTFASILLAYGVRVLWQIDPEAASGEWHQRLEIFEAAVGKAFSEVTEPVVPDPDA